MENERHASPLMQASWTVVSALALLLIAVVALGAMPQTAQAATVNTVTDTTAIVDTSLQIELDYDNMTVTWGDGITGKVMNGADVSNGTEYHYLFLVERENEESWTLTNVCTIVFSNAATIGGRSIDVTITVNTLSFGTHYTTSRTGEDTSWVEFGYLNSSTGRLHFGNIHDGYLYRAQNYADITTTITWSDSNELVELPFFMVISDLDAGSATTYTEAWEAISGFTEFWVYEDNLLNIEDNKFSCTYVLTDNEDSFIKTGVYGSTQNGLFRSIFSTGYCMTGYTLYCSYFDDTMDSPSKTADVDTAQAGDTVNWAITETFGEFLVDTVSCYESWTLTDALPDGVTYVSATVVDSNGADLTSSAGTLSYNSSTRTVTFAFKASYLENESNYNGQTITLNIVTTVDADAAGTVENTVILDVSGIQWSASDSVEVLTPVLSITKSVGQSSYSHGDAMTWTVTVTNSGTGVARSVEISDTLPTGLSLAAAPTISTSGTVSGANVASGSSGAGSWSVTATTMAVGASITVTFTTTAPTLTTSTTYTNTASAKASYLDSVTASAQTTVGIATGSLKISKTVQGGTSATASQSFELVISANDPDGAALSGSYSAVLASSSGTQTSTTVSFSGGTATVSLQDDESITISGLLHGTTFTVIESSCSGYTTTSSGASGTITSGSTSTASFVNSYAATGSWTPSATKTLEGDTADLSYYAFDFALADSEGNIVLTATSNSDGTVTFEQIDYTTSDLGTQTYTMYEIDGGDEDIAYDDKVVQVSVSVVDNGDGTLTVTPTYDGVTTLPAFENFYETYEVVLPVTGQSGITGGLVAGVALVIVGAAIAFLAVQRPQAATLKRRRHERQRQ